MRCCGAIGGRAAGMTLCDFMNPAVPCPKVDGKGWLIQLENGSCRVVEHSEERLSTQRSCKFGTFG